MDLNSRGREPDGAEAGNGWQPQFAGAPQRSGNAALMLRILDEIGYGMAVLSAGGHLQHANQLALESLRGGGALMLREGRLQAKGADQQAALARAVSAAVCGRRQLLLLDDAGGECPVALIPLPEAGAVADGPPICLMVMGKRRSCEVLTLTLFAQACNLTPAEVGVLRGLCGGDTPKGIAHELGVAVSTVRTQIGSVLSKTQTHSIRELARRIAALPPITLALKSGALN